MIGEAIQHLRRAESAGERLMVSVNVSAHQLRHSDFATSLLDRLRAAEVPPSRFSIEITERVAVGSPDGAMMFDRGKQQVIFIPDHPATNVTPGNPGTTNRTYELWFQSRNLPTSSDDDAVQRANRQIIYEEGGTTRGISIYPDGTQPDNPFKFRLAQRYVKCFSCRLFSLPERLNG